MPHLRVNADGTEPVLETGAARLTPALGRALTHPGPIIILIHGYKFSPFTPGRSPHAHILSPNPQSDCRKALSWPRHLGFGRGRADEGLSIGFGWDARGSIWRAAAQAQVAADALALLVARIARLAPGCDVHLVAHSLGAGVALRALALLPPGKVRRTILIAAAAFRGDARAALARGAGEVINVTSRENDLFDLLAQATLAPHRWRERTLGHGLGAFDPDWLDLQIDHAQVRAALGMRGFPIGPPTRRICHRSGYLRPGIWPFYRAALRRPETMRLDELRPALPPLPSRHLSRLLAPPPVSLPLPFGSKAPS